MLAWAKSASAGFSPVNVTAETVATSPMFREAFKRRRCLVPVDLFYERQKTGEKTKQPYAIGLSTPMGRKKERRTEIQQA